MKVIWLTAAEQDRDAIIDHIAADNPAAAERMDDLFSDAVTRLASFPMLGRAGRISGTREIIPHESYRLVYAVLEETVWVVALIHTARIWPPTQIE